ncbi:RICIN domain-containing protein [Streptomyces sp. NPDC017248]|uniref:RICIN domain-containing protein n=1 Tax=unclassified Streptomyces TaxID=2593676 RepID=UPI0037886A82
MDDRALALREVRTAADLNAALCELKARSRLTYRQLEERAAEKGEPLPRSTLADVLRNGSLPRQELLTAFVRACGEGGYVDEWLAARQRAAEAPPPGQGPGAAGGGVGGSAGPGGPGATGGSRDSGDREEGAGRPVRRLLRAHPAGVLAGSLLAAALAAAAAVWSLGNFGGDGRPARLPHGQVLLRPLGSPGLCVTDGQVPDGRYHSLVAVQRPCDQTAPQTTTLDPVGEDAYRIAWYRPDQGKGCLKALTEGPGRDLLEPWDACERTTAFRFVRTEPAGSGQAGGTYTGPSYSGRSYLIKISDDTCVGIRDGSGAEGTEAVVEPCTGADAQLFVVEAVV